MAVAITAWVALDRIKTQTKNNSRESLQTVLQTTREAMHIWVHQRKQDVSNLASMPELRKLTQSLLAESQDRNALLASQSLEKIRKIIKSRLDKYGDRGFFIAAPNMTNIASLRDINIGVTNLIYIQRKDYLQRVFQGEVSFVPTIRSDVPLPGVDGQLEKQLPAIFVASPIRDNVDKIIAVLALQIDPARDFTRIAQLGRIGNSGETYAFDEDGVLITESRFDQQLKNIGLIKPNGRGILTIRITDPGGNLLEGFIPSLPESERKLTMMAQSATSDKSGFNVEGYRDYRGVPVFGTWMWDGDLGFGLTTEIDEFEALQPYYSTRMIVLSVMSAIVLLSFVLSFALIWRRKKSERMLESAYAELEVRVDERTRELREARDYLEVANRKLAVLATTDSLTGLKNRRSFNQHLDEEWLRCQRDKKAISIVMIDVDYFKDYNDFYGHQAGDECLMKIGEILRNHKFAARPGDMVARYGGEEFIILLSGTASNDAVNIAEEISQAIRDDNIEHEVTQVHDSKIVTASFGVATQEFGKPATAKESIDKADQALYRAKSQGRNRVVVFEDWLHN